MILQWSRQITNLFGLKKIYSLFGDFTQQKSTYIEDTQVTEKKSMKRRNVELTKNRKQFHFRKYRFTEGMIGSNTFVYMKFLLVWVLIMAADYLLEFRFEYLWPFWLMIRSMHDSIKYQGIIFTIFFAFIAFLSDLLFYMFLPVQWLFFAASTYVWVQYVWHTEKGICLPTISLWFLFVYIEVSLRFKTLKSIDFCRPFAAHCIGYPMVTLGFGVKSYLSYKLRLKRQKEIQKQNEFHTQLIAKALPLELQIKDKEKFKPFTFNEDESSIQQTCTDSPPSPSLSSSTSVFSTLVNLVPLMLFFNNSTSQSQSSLCKENNRTDSSKSTNSQNTFCNNNSSQSGLITSLNNNNSSNSNSNGNGNANIAEEAAYIQQKDIKHTFNSNSKSNKYFASDSGNISNESQNSSAKQNNNNSDLNTIKGSFTSSKSNSSFSNMNNKNFSDPSFTKSTKTNSKNSQSETNSSSSSNCSSSNNNNNSVNCNVSSFSISSLAYSTSTTHHSRNGNNTNHTNASTHANPANGNTNGSLGSLNGNLVLLSNSKMDDNDENAHHRSSSTSSTSFMSANSANHTNININMTINATAIAAATATANAPKLTNGNSNGTSKSRKNKENSNQHRANSVASSTSSSSSDSLVAVPNNGTKSKNKEGQGIFSFKDDLICRLEEDLKKLREENEQQKSVEQYLRNQINYITKCDRTEKQKLEKLQQENKTLQTKLTKLTSQGQKEKEDLESSEKRYQEEKRLRQNLESQLAQERKHRETQDIQISDLKKSVSSIGSSIKLQKQEDSCKLDQRVREMEIENKKLSEEVRKKQDHVMMLECELKSLNRTRDTESRVDTLMVALNLMEDKNASLQESLSAETRFKLDLFSALGEARRQLESVNFQLKTKDRELNALKTLFKQTLSVSGNGNLNNNVLNNYLNCSNETNQSQASDSSNSMCLTNNNHNTSTGTSNTNGNISNSSSILSSHNNNSNSNLNEWSTGGLTFMPKI